MFYSLFFYTLLLNNNKDIQMTVKTQQIYYNLLLQGYMFRLLRVIIRPSNEHTQDYLIPSALWDPVALTIVVVIQGGSNMTGTDLYVNKPHCAAAVRP